MNFSSIVSDPCLDAMKRLARASPPEGAFAEVGVYRGGSALHLYEVAQAQGRALHLFDTFAGMPISGPLDYHKVGEFADHVDLPGMRERMPNATFHVGLYPTTHPEDLGPLSFIHCDCDQYDSYRAVIDHMYPLLLPGGMLLFDDYPYLAGAKQAVLETFSLDDLRPTGSGRFYVVKP